MPPKFAIEKPNKGTQRLEKTKASATRLLCRAVWWGFSAALSQRELRWGSRGTQAHKHMQQHRSKERKTQHNCTVRGTPKVVFVAVRDGGWRRSVRVGRRRYKEGQGQHEGDVAIVGRVQARLWALEALFTLGWGILVSSTLLMLVLR